MQLTTTSAALLQQQQTLSCPEGSNWKSYPPTQECFWETSFETSRLSWDDARLYCQAFGGDLASFHGEDEEKIGLSFQYGSLAHPYWIGLRLNVVDNTWKWSDGTPLDYENWAPGHPDHKDKRLQCVALDASQKHWVSSLCGIVSWFVCRAPKQASQLKPTLPTRPPVAVCPSGDETSYFYKDYCYTIVSTLSNWHRAKEYCENEGSSLVSLHSDEEIGFLMRILYDDRTIRGNRVWIGLNSLGSKAFRWTDWSPVDFTYWNENEPNNHQNQEKCCNMYTGNGLWNDEPCNQLMGFICKRPIDGFINRPVPTTLDPSIGNCLKGWLPHDDRCYLAVGYTDKDQSNWTDASAVCSSFNGYLVSIRDVREQAFLSYLMQGLKGDTWIGLHDTIQSGRYFWMDNTDLQYTNWAPAEPSFFGIQEDCVKMSYDELDSGVWRDDACEKRFPFICYTYKDKTLPKPDYNRGLDCIYPEGWLKLDNMCFKMFAGNPKTWSDAETACQMNGAHLVSHSTTSVQAVANYLGVEVNQTYWIGLQYSDLSQKFSWLSDWPMTISKWAKGQPSAITGETCFGSTPDGYWEPIPCSEPMPFLCQITSGRPPVSKRYVGSCPNNTSLWKPTDGSFCHLYERTFVDWFSANIRCFRHGSYLISLHSLEELEMVRKTAGPGVFSVFIGLVRNTQEGFSWSDGTPVDFVNWDTFQPSTEKDNCVEMWMDTLKWRVVPCFTNLRFVCYAEKDQEVAGMPESEKFSADSSTGLPTTAMVGIVVACAVLLIAAVVAGTLYFRPYLVRSAFRNPFRRMSVSYENALFNVDSGSMEFQEDGKGAVESR